MRILVTGGAGFIGSNFVYHMSEQGHEIVVLDKLTYAGGLDNLESLGSKIKIIIGDVSDRNIVAELLKDIDWVVHFAAESHVTRSESMPEIFYHTNIMGTKVILEEAFNAGAKKIIHISTDEVYGTAKKDTFFKEEDKIPGDNQAASAYAKSKSLADDIAQDLIKKGYPIIITRTTNNFGPWQFPEKALPRWITNLLLGSKIPLWGEGLQVRDWLFAPENAKAIDFILTNGKVGEVYNVAANNRPEITNRQAAEMVCITMGLRPSDWISYVPDPRPNHDFRYAIDTTKLESLGWQPIRDIEQQLKVTVEWYKNNHEWWEKRKQEAEKIYR
jgi:dTDP-glucose 4,6-dehydratase